MDEKIVDGCEKFMWAVYGKSKFESVDEVHHLKLKAKAESCYYW